ncbi:MAG: protein translocase subunit SecD [Acidobacteria bacterium]|nr:protein translocase subunit SecD [Acidobacteriota bacterium]
MTSRLWSRLAITFAVTLVCLYGIFGLPTSLEEAKQNVSERIQLGLDLKGGTHLILQVQVQDAIRAEADATIQRIQEDFRSQGILAGPVSRNDPQSIETADSIEITVAGVPTDRAGDFRNTIDTYYLDWLASSVDSSTWSLKMRASALSRIKGETLAQSIATIENRVNGLGLTEPVIQQHGRGDQDPEILVEIPGVDDPARVIQILQMSAQLEIQKVLNGPYLSRQAALAANSGVLPPNSEILPQPTRDATGQATDQWYILERTSVVGGRDIRNARPARSTQTGQWETSFTLSRQAGVRFGQFTAANIGQPLSVVLDNRIKNVATIEGRIDSEGVIQGLSGEPEASDLALVLRTGSLPASVVPLEERTVGASLGADSIRQGVSSSLYGLAFVAIAMLLYYKAAGINANIALLLNLIILVGCLSYFGFALTLPGIAGIVLTIGMAVDANVLIFERIREELRAGKGVVAAINAGFGKAVLTIVDTNLTTIIAAAFLFLFGRGPIRGFALTLGIGLIANMFTSVFVSRLIFDLSVTRKAGVKEMSI